MRLSVPHYLRLQVEDAETATDCAAYRRQLTIDSKSRRTEMLGDLTANYNGIPRSYYRFGASWPHVRETLLVIQEQDGDPSIDGSGMLFEDFSDLLHSGPSSLDSIHF